MRSVEILCPLHRPPVEMRQDPIADAYYCPACGNWNGRVDILRKNYGLLKLARAS